MMSLFGLFLLSTIYGCLGHSGHGGMGGIPQNFDPNNPQNPFNDVKVTQDQAHIQEHLKEEFGSDADVSKMTPEQLEFHYFRIHDSNGDNKLDGLEILKALYHNTQEGHADTYLSVGTEGKSAEEIGKIKSERLEKLTEFYSKTIDQMLAEDDSDQDGYLTYHEYGSSRKRNQARLAEVMKNINPEQLQQLQQTMSQMNQMSPDQMQQMAQQAQQLKDMKPDQMQMLRKQMEELRNMTPEQVNQMTSQLAQQHKLTPQQVDQMKQQYASLQKLDPQQFQDQVGQLQKQLGQFS